MSIRRPVPIALAAVALAGASVLLRPGAPPPVSAAAAEKGPPPVAVRVVPARAQELRDLVSVPASVVSRNDARVAAEVAGPLEWVAEVGDSVAAGQVVARVDDTGLSLRLRESEAEIRRLEAQDRYLDQQVDRLERLSSEGVVAANDLEEMQSQRQSNEEALAQALASRDRIAHEFERTQVRAPFAGRVAERLGQPGGYVSVGNPILRLVDTSRVEVQARAPLSVAPWVRDGMSVVVREGAREVEGRVRAVVPVGDERSRMLEVRVALPEAWVIGSAVRVVLPQGEARTGVAVPRDALVLRQEGTFVFRVDAAQQAERIAVETGVGQGSLIEVLGGIADGDRVVVRGAERLRPGQAVSVEES